MSIAPPAREEGRGIVELESRSAMPTLFESPVRGRGPIPAPASKHRAAIAARGLCPGTRKGSDA